MDDTQQQPPEQLQFEDEGAAKTGNRRHFGAALASLAGLGALAGGGTLARAAENPPEPEAELKSKILTRLKADLGHEGMTPLGTFGRSYTK